MNTFTDSLEKGRRAFYGFGRSLPPEVNEPAYIAGLIDRHNDRPDLSRDLREWLVKNEHALETEDGYLM